MKFGKIVCAVGLSCTFAYAIAAVSDSSPDGNQVKKFSKEELRSEAFNKKLSEAYGHLVQKSLDNPVLKLNFDAVISGMQNGKAGKASPLTEEEYEEAIQSVQEFAYQEMSEKNLQEAEAFLKENATKSSIKEIQPGKLQCMILEEGSGKELSEDVVAEIHYKGQYANGQVFGSSEEAGAPISISLTQTIPGFRQGLVGMKEGGKRRLFIHPDLGYGTSGQLMPNALLIFDVELVKIKDKPAVDKNSKQGDIIGANMDDEMPAPDEDEEDYEDHDSSQFMNQDSEQAPS